MTVVTFSHSTGFPSRRVYRVTSTERGDQKEALAFMNTYGGMAIRDTRKRIKFILI